MRYAKLGKSGIDVSVLSLGCWSFAGGSYWGEQDEGESIKIIDAALDMGINFLDSAQGYENGVSERIVGKALKGKRDKAVIATKVSNGEHYHADTMIEACEFSLNNLQTDYIDLYYLHWPNMKVPFDDTMEGLERLKKQGKIRAAGISNFGLKQMSMLEDTGKFDLLEAHQLPYNLFWRAIEYGIQQKSIEKGLGIVCYSTLAQGLLSGKYYSAAESPAHLKNTRFFSDPEGKFHGVAGCEEEVFSALRELRPLCAEAGLTMPQACLAWLFRQKGVASLLTGPRNVSELNENILCMNTEISDEFAAKMSAISERVRDKIGANPDMWFVGDRARTY